MSNRSDQSPINNESGDNMSTSPNAADDPDNLSEEGFGSIDPFHRLSKRRRKIPVGIPGSHPGVSIAESGSTGEESARADSNHPTMQHRLLYSNPESKITTTSVEVIRVEYNIPDTIVARSPSKSERVDMDVNGWCPMYVVPFVEGFRFPFPPLISTILSHFEVAPCQLMPNAWRILLSLCRFVEVFGKGIELEDFMSCYMFKEHDADKGRLKIVVRSKEKRLVSGLAENDRGWKNRYLFFKGNDMFTPNSPEFPLAWKPFNKDFNRQPHLIPARKNKLDYLLSLPAEKRHYSRLLRKSDLFSSYLWAQVRLHSTVANDNFINKMSFKLPSTEDAMAAAAKKGKSHSTSTSTKSTELVDNTLVHKSVEVDWSKQQRTDLEGVEVKNVIISEATNVYLDPSTIEHHVDELVTDIELKQIKEMGSTGVLNDIVASSYRALIGATWLRNATKTYLDRIKQQRKNINDLNKEKEALNEEIKQLKVKAAQAHQLEIDLLEERKKVNGLTEEMNSLATVCLVKARGEMMLEYSRGRTTKWNVQSELDVFESFLPKDYADAVIKLDKEETSDRVIDGASEMADHQMEETDRDMLP